MVYFLPSAAFVVITLIANVSAFSVISSSSPQRPQSVSHSSTTHLAALSRRDALIFTATAAFLPLTIHASYAASTNTGPTAADLDRIKVGYSQITYLLNNFEQETTTCRENGGECKRDSNAVRKAMGLRSTTDPLFQIDKVFDKVKYKEDMDPDKLDAFFEAAEDWNSCMAMSNSMAFISQFGEYNPGGGKDEVLKYLEESRKQVILAEQALKRIMDALEISPA